MIKITPELINEIFTLKKKITKENEKIILSQYQDIIPLYDIYTHYVYAIDFQDVENKVLNYHFRFLSEPQYQTLKNYQKKLKEKKDLTELEKEFLDKMNYNLQVLDNYEMETLEKTSIQAFYYGSIKLGQSISICRRKSFHPKLNHLTPYYSLQELIKLGQNNNLLKKEITPSQLQDINLHYEICQQVGDNDISFSEILKNTDYLEKHYNLIKFFSIYGSSFVNQNYRAFQNKSKFPYPQFLEFGEKINKLFDKSPGLNREYYLYRFIWEDSFLENLKIGDVFIDGGLLSTTRNPFYTPETAKSFGLILLKITVPKEFDKLLMIESISAFPKEEEIIFPSFTKLKLISKDNKFKYYHIDETLEKIINKRYHFKVVGQEKTPILSPINFEIPILNPNEIELYSKTISTRLNEFIKNFTNEYYLFKLSINNKIRTFQAVFYDSTSSYRKIFSQTDEQSLLIFELDENYAMKNAIELSQELVFNYQEKDFPNTMDLTEEEILEYLKIFSQLFTYQEANVYLNYTRKNYQNYPKILENPEIPFKNRIFYQNFSIRDFIDQLNTEIPQNILKETFHPQENIKKLTWNQLFKKYLLSTENLETFYQIWNDYNEIKLPYDLSLKILINSNQDQVVLPFREIKTDTTLEKITEESFSRIN
jgi:hypothetical protein